MQLVQINFDNAFMQQNNFKQELGNNKPLVIDFEFTELQLINEARLFASKSKITSLKQLIMAKIEPFILNKPLLTFYGSGDFHHLTLALLEIAAKRLNKTFTVIHLDNHPDWCKDPVISCGSWVNEALKYNFVDKIITLGVCSNDLKLPELKRANLQAVQKEKLAVLPFTAKSSFVFKKYNNCTSFNYNNHKLNWYNVNNLNFDALINKLNQLTTTDYIYITVDKDVLNPGEQITNWDQGNMKLSTLLAILKSLISNKKIVGIDILGDYSTPVYGGSLISRAYKKFEVLLDQPKIKTKNLATIAKINEQVNLQLLKTLQN